MHPTKKILVPVDFSDCSLVALEYAYLLAQHFGAIVDVLNAWTTPPYVSPYLAVQISKKNGEPETLETLARTEANRQMEAFLARVPPPESVRVGMRIEFGIESEVIQAVAKSYDLIVMGTHGRSGVSQLLMGSVAEKVVRNAPCPAITVRKTGEVVERRIQKILVPVDFSPGSREALEHALTVAKSFGANVEVFHAWDMPMSMPTTLKIDRKEPLGSGDLDRAVESAIEKQMSALIHAIEPPPGVDLFSLVRKGDAAELITQRAKVADLIVMSTHGRSGISRAMVGSVAARVIRQAPCPVYTVRMSPAAIAAERGDHTGLRVEIHNVYALFPTAEKLQEAFRELLREGFDLEDLSLVMSESGYNDLVKVRDRTKVTEAVGAGGLLGGGIGGVMGLMAVLGSSFTAGVALLVLGPALAMAAAGGLIGALVGWGVPNDAALRIHSEIAEGAGLLVVHAHGAKDQRNAASVISRFGGEMIDIHTITPAASVT